LGVLAPVVAVVGLEAGLEDVFLELPHPASTPASSSTHVSARSFIERGTVAIPQRVTPHTLA
jgi:hypothetical protein